MKLAHKIGTLVLAWGGASLAGTPLAAKSVEAEVEKGTLTRNLFSSHCIQCHGKDGKVKGKVDLLKYSAEADLRECPAGRYCSAGRDSEGPVCERGYFCPVRSAAPLACPAGTYNPDQGKSEEADCRPCPRGRYCAEPGLYAADGSGPCAVGYLCHEG